MEGPLTTENLYKRTFSTLGSSFGVFMALALVAELPSLGVSLMEIVSEKSRISYERILDEEAPPDASWEAEDRLHEAKTRAIHARHKGIVIAAAVNIFLSLAHMVLAALASAATIYGVFQVLRGRSPRLRECVRVATGRWSEIVALGLMAGLTVFVGFLLLIVPGVMLYCGLFVALPALVVERLSPPDALKRSWNLTRGYKGVIFFVGFGIVAVGYAANLGSRWWLEPSAMDESFVVLALAPFAEYLVGGLTTALLAVATGVVYHDLRVFREGLDEQELAAVFE